MWALPFCILAQYGSCLFLAEWNGWWVCQVMMNGLSVVRYEVRGETWFAYITRKPSRVSLYMNWIVLLVYVYIQTLHHYSSTKVYLYNNNIIIIYSSHLPFYHRLGLEKSQTQDNQPSNQGYQETTQKKKDPIMPHKPTTTSITPPCPLKDNHHHNHHPHISLHTLSTTLTHLLAPSSYHTCTLSPTHYTPTPDEDSVEIHASNAAVVLDKEKQEDGGPICREREIAGWRWRRMRDLE